MAQIKELLAFLLIHYPKAEDLSKTRVTKLIYLCDWKHCIEHDRQITEIQWVYDNYGPFVWDVIDVVNANPDLFAKRSSMTLMGSPKLLLSIRDKSYEPDLSPREVDTANFVINATKDLSMDAFIKLVYSTFPIMTAEKYSKLNLVSLARQYRNSAVYKQAKMAA